MNAPLLEGLRLLHLEPGQSHQVQVNGFMVEIRRLEAEEKSEFADAIMRNMWLDVPPSPAAGTVIAHRAPLPLPDPPIIPPEDEEIG